MLEPHLVRKGSFHTPAGGLVDATSWLVRRVAWLHIPGPGPSQMPAR